MNSIQEKRRLLKTKLQNRERVFGAWVSYAHPSITETFVQAEFDFIAVDMEHSTISLEQAQRIIAVSQSCHTPCLPRPVSHSNDWVKPLLESGADGLIIQMVNTPEELEKIISHCKYPPAGNRSFGVNRAQKYGFDFDEYVMKWNESSSLLIQVESQLSVANIDALLSFDEVDAVMVGPYDISGSYDVPGQTTHPLVMEASDIVIEACQRHGKSCGTQVAESNEGSVEALFKQGYTFAILSSDLFVLWKWAEEMQGLMDKFRFN